MFQIHNVKIWPLNLPKRVPKAVRNHVKISTLRRKTLNPCKTTLTDDVIARTLREEKLKQKTTITFQKLVIMP